MRTFHPTDFLNFWRELNAQLGIRGEPEALHGEARPWFDAVPANWRNMDSIEKAAFFNRIVNERRSK